ncbi:Protein ECERIFERUM 26-like [Linum perenne]
MAAADHQAVTYICKRTVVSTKPVQPGKQHSLSVLDRLMGDSSHLKIVYYLRTPPDHKYESGEITKMLRESVSETLNFFPIVTGRLLKEQDGNKWMIRCNDAGIRMVEATAQGSVDQWLSHVDRDKEMKLLHWEPMFHKPYFWSTFYIQVTEFERGGVAIGLSCFHLLLDPVCATMFIKSWADIASHGKLIAPPFFHALPSPKPFHKLSTSTNANLINHYQNTAATYQTNPDLISQKQGNTTMTSSSFTTISFSFTDSMVRSCMDMARTPTGSPFEALTGLFWLILSKVKCKTDKLMDMSICLDARQVLGLDRGFFGNCMIHNKVQYCSSGGELSLVSLPTAAAAIGEAVEEIMDPSSVMSLIEWLKCNDIGDDGQERFEPVSPMNGGDCELVCIGLEGVEPYSVKFGDGFEPVQVSYHVEPIGDGKWHVVILPGNVGGGGEMGRVVMVTVPKELVGNLCGNELIRDLSPSIVMGG